MASGEDLVQVEVKAGLKQWIFHVPVRPPRVKVRASLPKKIKTFYGSPVGVSLSFSLDRDSEVGWAEVFLRIIEPDGREIWGIGFTSVVWIV